MKIGHLEAPTQPRHQGLVKVAELVKERTNGEVEFQLFPASQLGNARQMIEGVQFGTIEGTVMPAAFLGGFNPAVSILDIPFLFPDRSRQESSSCASRRSAKRCSTASARAASSASRCGPTGASRSPPTSRSTSSRRCAGQKFRVMDSKILIEQFAAVGASAVAIQFGELYTALQTGVIDGQENPLDTISTMKFHEVQKNLVVTEHGVDGGRGPVQSRLVDEAAAGAPRRDRQGASTRCARRSRR